MSNKKQSSQRNIKNVFAPENKSKLLTISAVALALGVYAYHLNSSSNLPEMEVPAMESSVQKFDAHIEKDTTGQTQLTDDARKMERQLNNQKVVEQIESGESKIFERKEELKPITYTPKNTLEVVETPKVEVPKVEVKQAQETTAVAVDKEKNTTYNSATTTESYRAPSYAQLNRQQIDLLKTQMATLKFDELNAEKTDYKPTEFSYFKEMLNEQAKDKEQANRLEKVSQVANLSTTKNAKSQYIPSDRVVNDNTAGYKKSSEINEILFRAGQRVSAITDIKASSLQLGPILVTLADGEYAGAELMGNVTKGVDVLNFTFTTMWLPEQQIRIPIDAIALSFADQTVGTQTNVDNRIFRRFFLKPMLEGVAAAGEYYANDDSTTVTTNSGTVVQSKAAKTASTARKVALGSMAGAMSDAVSDVDTTQIVTQDSGTPVTIMFLSDVKIGSNDEQKSTSTEEKTTSSIVENNAKIVSDGEVKTNSNTQTGNIRLSRAEALALKNSKAATDPKIQAAITEALSTK